MKQLQQAIIGVIFACIIVAPVQAATQMYFVHNDHLGTPKVVTDQNQTVVWQGQQKPFGEVEETTATNEQLSRFPGQYFDEESNLHYNYFRDYDPSLGRYIQSDPIGLDDGPNTYTYVHGNPINYYDPNGESAVHAARGAFWAGGRIGAGINYGIQAATGATLGSLIYDAFNDNTYEMAAPGNVADTQISQDYGEAASDARQCGGEPPDRCKWLEENKNRYRADQVKRTQKAWGCRRSRRR